jgi:hypothetical protein
MHPEEGREQYSLAATAFTEYRYLLFGILIIWHFKNLSDETYLLF